MSAWPYPGDSPLARARRVTHAYRAALERADPAACAAIDQQMTRWGQTWVAPRPELHDLDDWIGPADAADLAAVDTAQLRVWRHRGRLTGRKVNGRWEYRVRDVLALISTVRHRSREATS